MNSFIRCISFALITGMAFTLISCTDLVEAPFSEITEENFNPTAKDVPSLIAPVYTPARQFMACCYSYVGMQDEAGDLYIKPSRPVGWGGPYIPYHEHNWDPTHPYVTTGWPTYFDGVNAANRVIHQIESGIVPVEDPLKTQVLAELRVARAFWYYLLMDNYGNVPIVTDFTAEDAPEQSTRSEVYEFVVQELSENIPNLLEASGLSTYGRFNQWAAIALLADVYLNAGVYRGSGAPSDGENGEWTEVIRLTDEIINSGRYALQPDYRSNFRVENHTSGEIIFAIPYDEVNGGGNTWHMQTLAAELQPIFGIQATPWNGGAVQPQFAQSYDEDDRRLEDTWIRGPQVNAQGDTVITFTLDIPSIRETESNNGWRTGKYELYQGLPVSSSVDLPYYRYADVLLMKAEALLRTGRADEAAMLVTQVRERVFEDPAEATVTAGDLTQNSTINYGYWENGQVVEPDNGPSITYGRFLDELGWEFAVEGHRRQDMIRFGAFTTKTWLNHRPSDPTRRIFPIPQSAIDTNPNLVQNPGY